MSKNRINDPEVVKRNILTEIIASGAIPVIQFSRPGYTRELLQSVNRFCAEFEDKLEVRFYGHYQGCFDAAVLSELRDARRVSIDSLTEIVNE